MLNGRSLPTTAVMTEGVETGLAVVGAHPAAPDSPERGRGRNHLCRKIIASDAATAGVADEGAEIVVFWAVPVGHQRRGPSVDVVDRLAQARIPHDGQHGAEDLLVGDPHAVVDVADNDGRGLAAAAVGQ